MTDVEQVMEMTVPLLKKVGRSYPHDPATAHAHTRTHAHTHSLSLPLSLCLSPIPYKVPCQSHCPISDSGDAAPSSPVPCTHPAQPPPPRPELTPAGFHCCIAAHTHPMLPPCASAGVCPVRSVSACCWVSLRTRSVPALTTRAPTVLRFSGASITRTACCWEESRPARQIG